MVSLRRPSTGRSVRSWHRSRSSASRTTAVGATATVPPDGLCGGSHPDQAGRGRGGLHEGQGGPAALGAVPPGLGGGVAARADDRGRRGRGGRRPAARRVVAERLPDRLRRGRGGAGHEVRLRQRDAARTTPGRARSGSLSNGTGRAGRSGTTSWRSPARTSCSPGWDILTCGGSRSGSGGSRRRRCSGRSKAVRGNGLESTDGAGNRSCRPAKALRPPGIRPPLPEHDPLQPDQPDHGRLPIPDGMERHRVGGREFRPALAEAQAPERTQPGHDLQ